MTNSLGSRPASGWIGIWLALFVFWAGCASPTDATDPAKSSAAKAPVADGEPATKLPEVGVPTRGGPLPAPPDSVHRVPDPDDIGHGPSDSDAIDHRLPDPKPPGAE
jgi:hypothetical protein